MDITVRKMIEDAARLYGVDPLLAVAIALVESAGLADRVRYEPRWGYLVNPDKYAKTLGITEDTEVQLQKFSWGCLQIMGSNARALGFPQMLTLLAVPAIGIEYGIRHLKTVRARFPLESDAIAAYNSGTPVQVGGVYRNQAYVQKVMDRLQPLREGK